MTEELKSCPFCRQNNIAWVSDVMYDTDSQPMMCRECGAQGPLSHGGYEWAKCNWNDRASPWVRVEDGLPEHEQNVLIKIGGCERIIDVTFNDERGMLGRFIGPFKDYRSDEVTHWMPIPEIEG